MKQLKSVSKKILSLSVIVAIAVVVAGFIQVSGKNEANTVNATGANGQIGGNYGTCTDNYLSWTNSYTLKTDAAWSTAFVDMALKGDNGNVDATTGHNGVYNNFERDINGDGLPDYMSVQRMNVGLKNYDCVYLSNGHGWDLGYKCVTVSEIISGYNYRPRYYGDCAQQ